MMDAEKGPAVAGTTGEAQDIAIVSEEHSIEPPFPLYASVKDTRPAKFVSLSELVAMASAPTVGPKDQAQAITPFHAQGKKTPDAEAALFYAAVQDHDDDDLSYAEIADRYNAYGRAFLAFTTGSHLQDKHGITAQRWKVILPFSRAVGFERYHRISSGLALMLGTDEVQQRKAQVFYAPNKISEDAPYDFIDATDLPYIDPLDDTDPLVSACLAAYQAEEERKAAIERKAIPKPRHPPSPANAGIIDKVNAAFRLPELLASAGYRQQGKRFLSPWSSTGTPGVSILERDGKQVAYSHHGESDPLSNLNHDGHALDVFDVITALEYGGDATKAVAEMADKVDPEGQKQRQQEHQQQKAVEEAAEALEASQAGGWAEPVDLFGNLEPPAFPIHLLPRSIADYAKDQAELMGVDPAIIGMGALAVTAACLDDRIKIQPKRYDPTWTESARLWITPVGDPSTMKSPGLSKAMTPAFKINDEWRKDADEKWTAYEQARKRWEKKAIKEDAPGPQPEAPQIKRLIYEDATVEKMADLMAKHDPRGVLVYRDELTGWLSSMDAYKNGGGKDRAAWLEAYNGGSMTIDRVQRGSSFVENWSACILGGIQPSVIHEYAKVTNHDGMLQRFIIVFAKAAGEGEDRRPNMAAKSAYEGMIEQVAGTTPGSEPVTLTEAAHKAREALYSKLSSLVRLHPNPYLVAALGKWKGTYARLLLTFHAAECAERGAYPTSEQVKGETAELVAALMWDCLLPHAVKFYQQLDDVEDKARLVAGLLLARGWERFTVKRDLDRNLHNSRSWKPWELDETMQRLESFGWLLPEPGKVNERGKPSAYVVNPLIHERFREVAAREKERRVEITKLMGELGS